MNYDRFRFEKGINTYLRKIDLNPQNMMTRHQAIHQDYWHAEIQMTPSFT